MPQPVAPDRREESELERLRRENEQLRKEKAELERDRERLQQENNGLREKLEAVQREVYRQAGPFRVDPKKRVQTRKKPGRKPGHPGACRARPDVVDDHIVVPLEGCPQCGKAVSSCHPIEQFIEDLPEVKPRVTRITTFVGLCGACGPVESHHPMQMSKASGAAAVSIGPRALAVATDLNKRLGVPLRKTCDVLWQHFALRLTPGALTQAQQRLAQRLEPAYQELAQMLKAGRVVYVDETSWWVGGPGYWLWVFTSGGYTLFVVDQRRNKEVVLDVLGGTYEGVLSTDCLNIYDGLHGIQNKCYAHHLKAISKAIEAASGDKTCLLELRSLLHTAIALGKSRHEIPAAEYRRFVESLERRADALLQQGAGDLEANKVAHRLLRQRDHLFTFLKHPGVDPTNNAAERALRPAVVTRKISCGNRTERGQRTWQVLASLAATSHQRGSRFTTMIERAAPLSAPTSLGALTSTSASG